MVEEEDWDVAGRVRVRPELLALGFSFGIECSFGRGLVLGFGRGFCVGLGLGFEVVASPGRNGAVAACGSTTEVAS